MVNIRPLSFFALIIFWYVASACASDPSSYSHLGNSGKKFTPVTKMSYKDWSDPQELERVWQASFVRIPEDNGKFLKLKIAELNTESLDNIKNYPTVIYMHGCSGYWAGTIRRINFLAKNGFAVIAPPSFARIKYPRSCDISSYQGGLYRDTIKMRQNDAAYAIANAKKIPWVNKDNLFLMGLSEGAITTVTFHSKEKVHSVRARVAEGWTCTSIWREYNGVRAPKEEPVLTLLGLKDPWFQNPYTNGECTKFLNKKNGSKSIVYRKGNLSYKHELLEDEGVKQSVLDFLNNHLK